MNGLIKFVSFFVLLTLSFVALAGEPIKVKDLGAPDDGVTKSLDELKDMCLNPHKYHLQSPIMKLEITGVLTWTKWVKSIDPVYLVETQMMNNFGSFKKNGMRLDGSEWMISDGKLSNVVESNSSCVVEGVCVQYVEHVYTKDLINKTVTCDAISKSTSVEELYGLTLADLTDITNVVPSNEENEQSKTLPSGFTDTIKSVYPAACPKSLKPANLELCAQ